MKLTARLNYYDKETLKEMAYMLDITGISRLNKAQLAERIASEMLAPEKLFYRMALVDDWGMELLKAGAKATVMVPPEDDRFDVACVLKELELARFDADDSFSTLEDVWAVYEKEVAGEKFEAYRTRASWVWRCLHWAEYMYGCTPKDVFLKVVNVKKGMRMTADEFEKIWSNIPNGVSYSVNLEDAILEDYFFDHKDQLKGLLAAQADKEFYIPTVDEVDELYHIGALLSKRPYRELEKFLTGDLKMDRDDAKDLLLELWDKLTLDNDQHGTLQWFLDQLEFHGDNQINKFMPLYMAACNGTNLLVNRGFAPADMPHVPLKPGQMPKIVPGSSHAAEMLSEAMPKLKEMGFDVDFDYNAKTIPVLNMPAGPNGPIQSSQKKIYPNDPCPCGSGKKFKKCCGKN